MSRQKKTPRPVFATPDEAAQFLNTTPQHLKYLRRVGRGPAYSKTGRYVRYLWKDLHRYAAESLTWGE